MKHWIFCMMWGLSIMNVFGQDETEKTWKPKISGYDSIAIGSAFRQAGNSPTQRITVFGLPVNKIESFPKIEDDLVQLHEMSSFINAKQVILPIPPSYAVLFDILKQNELPEWANKIPGLGGEIGLNKLRKKSKIHGYLPEWGNDATWMILKQLFPEQLNIPDSIQTVVLPILRIASRFENFYGMDDEFGTVADVVGNSYQFKLFVNENFSKHKNAWKTFLGKNYPYAEQIFNALKVHINMNDMEDKGLIAISSIGSDLYMADFIQKINNEYPNDRILILAENRHARSIHYPWEYPGITRRLMEKGINNQIYHIGTIEVSEYGATYQPDNDLGPLFDGTTAEWNELFKNGFSIQNTFGTDSLEKALSQRYSAVIFYRVQESTNQDFKEGSEVELIGETENREAILIDTAAMPAEPLEINPYSVQEAVPNEKRSPRVYQLKKWRFADFGFGTNLISFNQLNQFLNSNGLASMPKQTLFWETSSGYLRHRKIFRETYLQGMLPIVTKPGDTSTIRFQNMGVGFRIGIDFTSSKRFNVMGGIQFGYAISRFSYALNRLSDPFLKNGFSQSVIFSVNNPHFTVGPFINVYYMMRRINIFAKAGYVYDLSSSEWRNGRDKIYNPYTFSMNSIQAQAGFGFVLDAKKPFRF